MHLDKETACITMQLSALLVLIFVSYGTMSGGVCLLGAQLVTGQTGPGPNSNPDSAPIAVVHANGEGSSIGSSNEDSSNVYGGYGGYAE